MHKHLWIALGLLGSAYVSAQTFDLSSSASSDPAMLAKAMPVLAEQVAAVYKDDDRSTYLDHLFRLQMVAGKYQDALVTLNSLREIWRQAVIPSRATWVDVPYEIYSQAKVKQAGPAGLPFKDAYEHAFDERFAQLGDWPAAQVLRTYAYTDPADTLSSLQRDLEGQKTKNTITLADALGLVSDYLANESAHDPAPLIPALVAHDDARRYIVQSNFLVSTPHGAGICAYLVRPLGAARRPALLNFSIYVGPSEQTVAGARLSAANGYVGVAAFTRGKACSPGKPEAYLYDGEDAAAVVDWMSAQPWSDGRVGMFGGSYEGFTQWATAKHMPKALKAMMTSAPAAPGLDVPMEGNVFWNFIYPWPFYTLNKKTDDDATYGEYRRWQKLNHDWYTSGRAYRDLDKIDGTPNPTFDQWISHPRYDAYWQRMIPYQKEFAQVTIPVLLTAGYYAGGPGAALYYYDQLEKYAPQGEHHLFVGPYDHLDAQFGVIGIQGTLYDTLSGMKLDPVADIDITELRYQWFNYIFKGASIPTLLDGKVDYEVTGANVWKHAPSVEAMGNTSRRFYLSSTPSAKTYSLSDQKPAGDHPLDLKVDLGDRSDVDRVSLGGGILDDAVDTHNGLAYVSDPLTEPTEMSGLFSGRLDFIANKKDFDFEMDLYEMTPQAKYVQLTQYWSRASYPRDRSHRELLTPGKRQQLDFKSIRLMSRKLQKGSRLVMVLTVVKEPDRQINYGTGRDVSDETIKDANPPLTIQWFSSSYIDVPISK